VAVTQQMSSASRCLVPDVFTNILHAPPPRPLQYCNEAPGRVDYKKYLSGWFLGAPYGEIKRENIEEFVAYGFCYKTRCAWPMAQHTAACCCRREHTTASTWPPLAGILQHTQSEGHMSM
jgi:hypothetical protein